MSPFVPFLPDAQLHLADGVEPVGVEFAELRALVGVQQVEDDSALHVRPCQFERHTSSMRESRSESRS